MEPAEKVEGFPRSSFTLFATDKSIEGLLSVAGYSDQGRKTASAKTALRSPSCFRVMKSHYKTCSANNAKSDRNLVLNGQKVVRSGSNVNITTDGLSYTSTCLVVVAAQRLALTVFRQNSLLTGLAVGFVRRHNSSGLFLHCICLSCASKTIS